MIAATKSTKTESEEKSLFTVKSSQSNIIAVSIQGSIDWRILSIKGLKLKSDLLFQIY